MPPRTGGRGASGQGGPLQHPRQPQQRPARRLRALLPAPRHSFDDVRRSIAVARQNGLWVSLNLLFFPGVTDSEGELEALARLVGENGVSTIQWRNLNIDPEWYLGLMRGIDHGPVMGLSLFMKRLKKLCPLAALRLLQSLCGREGRAHGPLPGQWRMPDLSVADAPWPGRFGRCRREADTEAEE